MPFLNTHELTRFITDRTGHDERCVGLVLALEEDYLAAAGISSAPRSSCIGFYSPDDATVDGVVDTKRIGDDAPRALGVAAEVAHEILCAESAYLLEHGFVG